MHKRHTADPASHGPSTAPVIPKDPSSPHVHRALGGDPQSHLQHHHGSHIASGSGSFSSGSKFPPFSSGDGTNPSSASRIRSPDTPLTPPTLVESPQPVSPKPSGEHIALSAITGVQPSSPGASPPSQAGSLPIPGDSTQESSTSSDEQLPTRASIRAWAKATPAGPPRNTPSPTGSAVLPQSSSDDNLDRKSLTRSAGHHTVSSTSLRSGTGSGSGTTTSSDEDDSAGSRLLPFAEESSGNVADVESSGSGGEDSSPQETSNPSPSASPPARELLAPAPLQVPQPHSHTHPHSRSHAHPHPHPHTHQHSHAYTHPHPQSSSSESPPPAIAVPSTQVQDQQERLDRRGERHPPHHGGRRRHRDRDRDREPRERRSRASNPTPPHPPQHAQAQTQVQAQSQSQFQAPSQVQTQMQMQSRPLRPLRLIPDLRLPAPPLPPPPLRPLQVLSGGGMDVLDEISQMLHHSRRPFARPAADPGGAGAGFWAPQRRENDVLDDMCYMIQMSRGR